MLTTVAVAGGYLLIAVPNVELLSLTIAFAGLLLGSASGAMVGIASGAIFSTLNVFGLPYPPVWIAQLTGYAVTGLLFGGLRRLLTSGSSWQISLKCAVLALITTFFYDMLTNIAFPIATGVGPSQWWAYILAGIPFMITHLVSNTLLFAVLLPIAYKRLGVRYAL